MPGIDQTQAKRIAHQLSSVHATQQSVSDNNGDANIKMRQTLRMIAQKMLNIAQKRRSSQHELNGVQPEKNPAPIEAAATLVHLKKAIMEDDSLSVCSAISDTLELPTNNYKTESTASKNNHHARVTRHHLLINLVGEDKYNEILTTSEEIKNIRHNSATWTKFSRLNASNGLHLDNDESSRDTPLSKTLPREIYELYFTTRLIDVMSVVDARSYRPLNELPEPCSCIVQRVDWDTLLEDAKRKLEAFRKFEMENVGPEDNLTFGCFGGICGRR